MLKGIDISSHQSNVNWNAVSDTQVQFVIVKATGGAVYKNPLYANQLQNARRLGKLIGHYHFAHESSLQAIGSRTPEQEADWFCDNADIRAGEIVALDIEDEKASGNLEDWALRWLRRAEARLGFRPFIYTYPHFAIEHGLNTRRMAEYPLWFASYYTPYRNSPKPATPGYWPSIAIWQWSGGTNVAGFAFPTDENFFYGTAEQWKALGKPGTWVIPPPTQLPVGYLAPIIDSMHWGADSAGVIVQREITVYNPLKKAWYVGTWDAHAGIRWRELDAKLMEEENGGVVLG